MGNLKRTTEQNESTMNGPAGPLSLFDIRLFYFLITDFNGCIMQGLTHQWLSIRRPVFFYK